MRQLAICNADVGTPTLRIPEGRYSMLYLVVEGLNTATAVDLADTGIVQITKNGLPIVASVDTANLMHYANKFGGRVGWSSTLSDALKFIVPIYCYDPLHPGSNVLHVGDKDLCQLNITWGANFTTRLDSGELKVCGEMADGVQYYIHQYAQFNYVLAAAGTIKERIPGENFLKVMFTDMDDADFVRGMIEIDGVMLHEFTRIEGLYASNHANLIEDIGDVEQIDDTDKTADTCAVFNCIPMNTWGEVLSDDLKLTIIASGGIEPEILVTSADFTPPEAALTKSFVASRRQARLQRKRSIGKGRAVSVYNQVIAETPAKTEAAI